MDRRRQSERVFMDTSTTIATQNPTWGFFGTLTTADVADAAELFDATARELMAQLGLTADEARMVLDSKFGRHVADQRAEGESAAALIARLIRQGWSGDIRRAAGQPVPKSAKAVLLRVQPDEVAVLRFALDHALSSTSEAHPQDRVQLQALIERLEAAKKVART